MTDILNNILDISNNKTIKILLVILMALIAQIVVRAIIKSVVKFPLSGEWLPKQSKDREKRIKTLQSIIQALASLTIWFVAMLIILGILKIPIAPLLTSAGLIGAALAFGMQSLIKDFISGIFIIAENQYRVDDYIELDKVAGTVEAITVRTTVLRDADGSLHHVPNGSIVISTNLSMGKIKLQDQIEVAPELTLDKIRENLVKIADTIREDSLQSKYIKVGPLLESVDKISAKSTTITISYITSAAKRSQARTYVMDALKQSDISLA